MIPRVLLLSCYLPAGGSVGRIFLREICRAQPPDRVACFSAGLPSDGCEVPGMRVRVAPALHDPLGLDGARRDELVREAVAFGREHGAELVWATFDLPLLYRLAPAVADGLGLPLVATVWDPPAHILDHYLAPDAASRAACLADFDRAMARTVRCGVASAPMKAAYERRHGRPCLPMIHGFETQLPARARGRPGDPLLVAVAGTLHAPHVEWRAFGAALAGRGIRLRILAHEAPPALDGVALELLGWRDGAQTQRLLGEADVGYVPYWMDAAHADAARLCFPSKLSAYVAARLPVFYHGPRDGSPAELLGRHPVGVTCDRLEPEAIRSALDALLARADGASAACGQAFDEELGAHVLRRGFATLVGGLRA